MDTQASAGTGTRTLITKLAKIMGEMERIPKNGRNDFHKYDYVTEADLVDAIRSKLADHKIFVFTSIESITHLNDITEVHTLHKFVDGETGEIWEVKGYGQGQDKGDKGGYKAMTGAMKYMLMKNFLVATGDDPEADGAKPFQKARTTTQAPMPAQPAGRPRTTTQAPPALAQPTPQPQPAPAQRAKTEDVPATKAQLDFIARLAKPLGISEADVYAARKIVGTPTKQQATAIIEELKAKAFQLKKTA